MKIVFVFLLLLTIPHDFLFAGLSEMKIFNFGIPQNDKAFSAPIQRRCITLYQSKVVIENYKAHPADLNQCDSGKKFTVSNNNTPIEFFLCTDQFTAQDAEEEIRDVAFFINKNKETSIVCYASFPGNDGLTGEFFERSRLLKVVALPD